MKIIFTSLLATLMFATSAQEYRIGLQTRKLEESAVDQARVRVFSWWYGQTTRIVGDTFKMKINYNPTVNRCEVIYKQRGQGRYRIKYLVDGSELLSIKIKAWDAEQRIYAIGARKLRMKLNRFQGDYVGFVRWIKSGEENNNFLRINLVLPAFSQSFDFEKQGLKIIEPVIKRVN